MREFVAHQMAQLIFIDYNKRETKKQYSDWTPILKCKFNLVFTHTQSMIIDNLRERVRILRYH